MKFSYFAAFCALGHRIFVQSASDPLGQAFPLLAELINEQTNDLMGSAQWRQLEKELGKDMKMEIFEPLDYEEELQYSQDLQKLITIVISSIASSSLTCNYPSLDGSKSIEIGDPTLIDILPTESYQQLMHLQEQGLVDLKNDHIDALTLSVLMNQVSFLKIVAKEAPMWFLSSVACPSCHRNVFHYMALFNKGEAMMDLFKSVEDRTIYDINSLFTVAWNSIDSHGRLPFEYAMEHFDETILRNLLLSSPRLLTCTFADGKVSLEKIIERDYIELIRDVCKKRPEVPSLQFGISGNLFHFLAASNTTKARELFTEWWEEYPEAVNVRNLKAVRPTDLFSHVESLYPEKLNLDKLLGYPGAGFNFIDDGILANLIAEGGSIISKEQAIKHKLFEPIKDKLKAAGSLELVKLEDCVFLKNESCIKELIEKFDFLVTSESRKVLARSYFLSIYDTNIFRILISDSSNFFLSLYEFKDDHNSTISIKDIYSPLDEEVINKRHVVSLASICISLKLHSSLRILVGTYPRIAAYRDSLGRTAVMHAIIMNDRVSLDILSESGIAKEILEYEDIYRENAFSFAVSCGRMEIVHQLIHEGAFERHKYSRIGLVPIHYVVRNGTLQMIKEFVRVHGRNQTKYITANGQTILHLVMYNKYLDLEMLTFVHNLHYKNAIIYDSSFRLPKHLIKHLNSARVSPVPTDCRLYLERIDKNGHPIVEVERSTEDWIPSHILQSTSGKGKGPSKKPPKAKKKKSTKKKGSNATFKDSEPQSHEIKMDEIDVDLDLAVSEPNPDSELVVLEEENEVVEEEPVEVVSHPLANDRHQGPNSQDLGKDKSIASISANINFNHQRNDDDNDDDSVGWVKIEKKTIRKSKNQIRIGAEKSEISSRSSKNIISKTLKSEVPFPHPRKPQLKLVQRIKPLATIKETAREEPGEAVSKQLLSDINQKVEESRTVDNVTEAPEEIQSTIENGKFQQEDDLDVSMEGNRRVVPPNAPILTERSYKNDARIWKILDKCESDFEEDPNLNRLFQYHQKHNEIPIQYLIESVHRNAVMMENGEKIDCVADLLGEFLDLISRNESQVAHSVLLSQLKFYSVNPVFTGLAVNRITMLNNLSLWLSLIRLHVFDINDFHATMSLNQHQESTFYMEKANLISYYFSTFEQQ